MSFKATAAGAAHEPTLRCPSCNHEIRLTESLAAPLLAETRQRFQEQLAMKDAEVSRKTEALRLEREQLARDREQVLRFAQFLAAAGNPAGPRRTAGQALPPAGAQDADNNTGP